MASRRVALDPDMPSDGQPCRYANRLGDGTSQLHFAFDISIKTAFRGWRSTTVISPQAAWAARFSVLSSLKPIASRHAWLCRGQENSQKLSQIETEVGKLTTQLAVQIKNPGGEVENLLSTLSKQAADLEDISSQTSYRLSATTAYESILGDRLEGLAESGLTAFRVRGF